MMPLLPVHMESLESMLMIQKYPMAHGGQQQRWQHCAVVMQPLSLYPQQVRVGFDDVLDTVQA